MSIRKGIFYERELLHFLSGRGFSVCRIPSSGSLLTPVDIIAMKRGLILCIECKAWSKKPKLKKTKLKNFKEWCKRAGAIGLLAWRVRGKWLFLRIEDAENGNYSDENWLEMETLLDAFMV